MTWTVEESLSYVAQYSSPTAKPMFPGDWEALRTLAAEVKRLRAHTETMNGGLRNAQAQLDWYEKREQLVKALVNAVDPSGRVDHCEPFVVEAMEAVRDFKVTPER